MTITDATSTANRRSSYGPGLIDDCTLGRGKFIGYPKLPKGKMRLINSIPHITAEGGMYGQGFAKAIFAIRPNLWFFEDHFHEDPVMPGCLMVDGLLQLTGFFGGWLGHKGKGRAREVGKTKFLGEVVPTSRMLHYRIDVTSVKMRGGLVIVRADGKLACDGKEVCNAQGLTAFIVPQ